ncbi:probable mediator of RNA polymerase II transcription subunit 26b [Quercus suber]|uniref:probable mediator of RNA polymerase II transcription subunit 26b n=1 Tax=Quercus suber TaxID=58331 RepID=UPI0032DF5A31
MANTRLTSNAADLEVGGSEQSKVDSSSDQTEMNTTKESKYSYNETEALTDEIDEESEIFLEVLRTKEILENSQDESETVIFESLRKLQLMVYSVEVLQMLELLRSFVTNIVFQKQFKSMTRLWVLDSTQRILFALGSQALTNLSSDRNLIVVVYSSGWKIMTNEWLDAAAIIAEGPVDSNPSTVFDEEGLPSPPLDEGALFASKTPIKLSQFFDGIDDDGNFELSMEYDKNLESGTKPLSGNQNSTKHNSQLPMEATTPIRDKKHQLTQQQSVIKLTSNTETSNTISKKGRTHNLNLEQKVNNKIKFQNKKKIHNSPSTSEQDKSRLLDEAAVQAKLKATKRKLQACYQQAENVTRPYWCGKWIYLRFELAKGLVILLKPDCIASLFHVDTGKFSRALAQEDI